MLRVLGSRRFFFRFGMRVRARGWVCARSRALGHGTCGKGWIAGYTRCARVGDGGFACAWWWCVSVMAHVSGSVGVARGGA